MKKFYVIIKQDCIELWFDGNDGERVFQASYYIHDQKISTQIFADITSAICCNYKVIYLYQYNDQEK